MGVIAGAKVPNPAAAATADVLALNTAMFELYGDSGQLVQGSILANHPIILALFSGAGGRLTLYRPGQPPLDAPSVPVVYQLLKSIGHSTMAIAVVAGPHAGKADDVSWIAPLAAYRERMKAALASLDATAMPDAWRADSRTIIQNNIAFMDDSLASKQLSFAAMEAFAQKQKNPIKHIIAWAAETQVTHWMDVLTEWKRMLGADWDKTYGASNTIYVARQNNVLFSVMAQFFGAEAINTRLMLIETMGFTTTQQEMLDSLTRIISDRAVGSLFFGNNALMDYELMGGDARRTIIELSAKRGVQPVLPPAVPFGSHQWPSLITAGPGPTSLADLP